MLYMVTFTINIPQMLAYIPYMDPMGYKIIKIHFFLEKLHGRFIARPLRASPRFRSASTSPSWAKSAIRW